jgi:NADH:ubiquinone reductase (H+-translocating)
LPRLAKAGLAVGGAVAAVGALRRVLEPRPRYAPWEKPPYGEFPNRVLVLGGGFGGYTAAHTLCNLTRNRDDIGVMVISRENFFTFWPMVPGVIGSNVDIGNIAQALRRPLIRAGASFRRAELRDIDFENRCVVADGREFPYDHLLLALGGQPNFFGIPGVEEYSLTMRGLGDALRIRDRVIERFEETTLAHGKVSESALTFVVIGGGATGVEVASEIHALVHEALAPDYPNIDPHRVRIVLLEAGPHILAELDPALRHAARTELVARRIEVMTRERAQEVTPDRVVLADGREIHTENVIWTAGNSPNAKLKDLDLPLTRRDGVIADEYLRAESAERLGHRRQRGVALQGRGGCSTHRPGGGAGGTRRCPQHLPRHRRYRRARTLRVPASGTTRGAREPLRGQRGHGRPLLGTPGLPLLAGDLPVQAGEPPEPGAGRRRLALERLLPPRGNPDSGPHRGRAARTGRGEISRNTRTRRPPGRADGVGGPTPVEDSGVARAPASPYCVEDRE